jgi:hypothetical protein
MSRGKLPARSSLDRSAEGIDSPANAYLAPSISGDAFAGEPAYAGKSLHVAVAGLSYSVWTNDGDQPIAQFMDAGTAHLLAAAPDFLAAAKAAVAYDAAIQSAANDPEKMSSLCTAEGADLDELYARWISLSSAAIAKATS